MFVILETDLAGADPSEPTIGEREYAGLDDLEDPGEKTKKGWEPAIAANADTVISVFKATNAGVKYAIYDPSENVSAWVGEGLIDPEFGTAPHDPSIAYNSRTGAFMAAARTASSVITSHFVPDPNAPNGFGEFEEWVTVAGGGSSKGYDKPWIVAGEMTECIQEYYIAYWIPLGYARSIDGGAHWADGRMKDTHTGEFIIGRFPHPTVCGDEPLYISYVKQVTGTSFEIRFLSGEDVDGDPNDPNFDPNDPNYVGVEFCHLYGIWSFLDGPVQPVLLRVPLINTSLLYEDHLPGEFDADAKMVPQLSADPNDPDRLYLVYNDIAAPGSHDVNIYLHRLTRPGGTWILSPRIKINNDFDPDGQNDQFVGSITVDHAGRIHISFYDDRNYEDQQDSEPKPKYDAFYAYSDDHGDTWFNERLPGDPNNPNEPALDWNLKKVDPHDYNGITCYGDTVWTTYAGTWSQDPGNKAVISSNRLDWPAP